jgi:hypothetical protein
MVSDFKEQAPVVSFLDHSNQKRKQDDLHEDLIDDLDEGGEVMHERTIVSSTFLINFRFPIESR